jgi:adenylate cyclase, class 2
MIMNKQETEVKIYVHDLKKLRKQLENLGAELLQERVHEHNVRYDMPDGSLNQRGAVLRLRQDNQTRLTYKEKGSIDKGIMTREELEVEVSDFAVMEAILGKFGFTPSMFYEKYRTTYALGQAEIMLDELPFGNFVEIEGESEAIEEILHELKLENAERRPDSYAKLFDYVKHHMGLNFRDLTFENFQDIAVPESAFIPPGSIVIR